MYFSLHWSLVTLVRTCSGERVKSFISTCCMPWTFIWPGTSSQQSMLIIEMWGWEEPREVSSPSLPRNVQLSKTPLTCHRQSRGMRALPCLATARTGHRLLNHTQGMQGAPTPAVCTDPTGGVKFPMIPNVANI